jgi:hypothetical protein
VLTLQKPAASVLPPLPSSKNRSTLSLLQMSGPQALDISLQHVRDWENSIDLNRLSTLQSLSLDFCAFDNSAVAALRHCAEHGAQLTSLRLVRDVINARVDANAHSSDAFLTHFVAQDRLLAFGKSPLDAVSESMLTTLANWFRHTTRLESLWFSDHIGNLAFGEPPASELLAAASLLDAAIRCTTLHSISMDGMWRSVPCDLVFSTVISALDASAPTLRTISFASVGLAATQTMQLLRCVSAAHMSPKLEDLDISSCRFDASALAPLEALLVSPHCRLTRLRMLVLRIDTCGDIVAPLFDAFGRSSSLRSLEMSRNKNIAPKACMLRSGEIDALMRFLMTPSFARLTCFHFGDFPQADAESVAAAAERERIVAALDRSARLVHANLTPLLPQWMLRLITNRNRSGAWTLSAIRTRALELCVALAPLDWPIYVMLDILDLDAMCCLRATPQSTKVAVIETVKRAVRQKQHKSSQ